MVDISLVPIEEILDELKSRYDSYILCGEKELDKEGSHIVFDYHGGEVEACGLADYVKAILSSKMVEDSKHV